MDDIKKILRYCAEECERQGSGERSVYDMFNAWTYADIYSQGRLFSPTDIVRLGQLVEPVKNENGYRHTPVILNNMPVSASGIMESVVRLCSFLPDILPVEFYKSFEHIHPFIDGNGRVGSILFNWLNKTLYNPVAPPDIFHTGA
jgi:hypothetical protein